MNVSFIGSFIAWLSHRAPPLPPPPSARPTPTASASPPLSPAPARGRLPPALRRHHVDGRLDTDELQERLGACYAARTLGELGPLLADLPGARRPAGGPGGPGAPTWASTWPGPAVLGVVAVVLALATLGALAHG